MYHPFSIAETFKTAWNVTKKNFLTILIYSAIATVLLGVVQFFNAFVDVSNDTFAEFIVFLILMIIQTYATLGLYKLIFTLIDNEYYEFEFSQLVPTMKMVFSFIAICLFLAFAIVTLNLAIEQGLQSYPEEVMKVAQVLEVMLILYAALRYMFCACFIVDDNSGPIESLRQSRLLTKSHMIHLLALLGMMVVVIALGFMVIGKAILVLYPFVNVVVIVTYRKLVYSNLDVDDDVAETH
ncbi:MAG: hypothetical protein V5804_08120 [Mucilaginibacter sp.]|uniref:hypothetical protein n=1 Tax=Mucilaginibacter sp. TaxID=1882438 RepID=UPI0034E404B2